MFILIILIISYLSLKITRIRLMRWRSTRHVIDVIEALCTYSLLDDGMRKAFNNILISMIEQSESMAILEEERWLEPGVRNQLEINNETRSYIHFVNDKIVKMCKVANNRLFENEFSREYEMANELSPEDFNGLFEKAYIICRNNKCIDKNVIRALLDIFINNLQNAARGLDAFSTNTLIMPPSSEKNYRLLFANSISAQIEEAEYYIWIEENNRVLDI